MWFELLCAIVVLFIFKSYYDSLRALILMWNVGGPINLPLLGIAHYYIGKTSSSETFQVTLNFMKKYGLYFKFWLGPDLKVVVQDPNDIEIILTSSRHIEKAPEHRFFKAFLDDGILQSGGKKWKDRRRALEPAFRLQMIEKSIEVFNRVGNTVVDQLTTISPNKSVQIFHIMKRYTLDVLCESAMGISMDALKCPDSEYVKAIQRVTYIAYQRITNLSLRSSLIFKCTKLYQEEKHASHVIHNFIDNIIVTRRQELVDQMTHDGSTKEHDNEIEMTKDRKSRGLLDILLQTKIDGKPLTDMDIREETSSFMLAGHHVISTGITLCLYNMAKFPGVQKKCYDEMVDVFGTDQNPQTTIPTLNQLVYLELVIKETMRLFSLVPLISRFATEDIKLTNNRIVPKGSSLIIPFYTIFRNPEYFKDPLEFNPDRFTDENLSDVKHPYAFIPFSSGPRNCMGQRYAMYEIKTICTKILRRFEVSLEIGSEQHPVFSADIALQPENPILFYLKPRI